MPGFLSGHWLLAVIDILIVAFLVYQLLLFVRGTRATHILLGIGLIVFLYYASSFWKLHTLHWLLTTLLPYFVFALIVIFQAEIRRGLARLGRSSFLPRLSRFTRSIAYDDILLAVSLFSSQKTGALMVIERDIGLRTFVESGIGLDAQLSYDLLVTIFRPGAPLHDGAAIIQGGKVAAAACFLPLSVNPLPGTQLQLGTRHRAAIGITEDTDAVAVVVSEQSGEVSLAVAGAMEQNITLEDLRVRLGDLFGAPISPSALATFGVAGEPPMRAEAHSEGPLHSHADDLAQNLRTPDRAVKP